MSVGLGVYLGRSGLTTSRARKYRAAGIRRVILCGEAVDGWRASASLMHRFGGISRDEGLRVSVYSFPGFESAKKPLDAAQHLMSMCGFAGHGLPVLDIESPFRGPAGAQRFVAMADRARSLCDEEQRSALVVTTLFSPSSPGGLPWPAMTGWARAHATAIGLQVYETAASNERVDARLAEVRVATGGVVFPCVATYKRERLTSEGGDGGKRLQGDLERACFDVDFNPVSGCDLWSGASLDNDELAACRTFTKRMGW